MTPIRPEPENGTAETVDRIVAYLFTPRKRRSPRGPIERFRWCRCGDSLGSLWDRLTGRCWICRSVR